MLKGFIVIFTGLISYYIFKRKFTRGQIGGVLIVVIGLVLVGLSNIYSYNSKCKNFLTNFSRSKTNFRKLSCNFSSIFLGFDVCV